MTQNIEACEWLTGALRGLEVPNLDSTYGNMRAVWTLVSFPPVSSVLWLSKSSSWLCGTCLV